MVVGVPLITSIYENSSEGAGLYTIALLIYHPLLIVFGSVFVPRLKVLVEEERIEREHLLKNGDDQGDGGDGGENSSGNANDANGGGSGVGERENGGGVSIQGSDNTNVIMAEQREGYARVETV
jgi:hypothetical protein